MARICKVLSASRHAQLSPRDDHHILAELSEIARLALPIVLTQIGQVAMMVTDLAFIGRTGTDALAAAALASRIYLLGFAFGLGLLAAIQPMAAQAFGANNLSLVRRSVRMGFWEAALLSLPITLLALQGQSILLAIGQTPDTARLAQEYLLGLAWGVPPALCFAVLRSFMGAVSRPEPVLWTTLAAAPINALLVYLLMYGKLGLPRLGLFGAGLATSLVNSGMLLAGVYLVTRRLPFRAYYVLANLWRFEWPLMQQLIVIGIPISIGAMMAYGASSLAALLAGRISASALAAHQVAVQAAVVLFMLSYGIGTATCVRVANAVGRNDGPGIKQAGLVGMLLGMVVAAILTFAIVAARFQIAPLFLGRSSGDADATTGLVAKLLLAGATCYITEAVATIATGALCGLKDTTVPPLLGCVAYWLVGISLGYVLSTSIGLGAVGIWIGLSIGASLYSALLALRFWLLANRSAC
ncbi:MATE family efflux transporter [Bradyrhizobium ottawaense]|uniref:MATE family efflux transporter n=1 Tax=Bradyrhizobium ottawaense TaxID=931866 RepID=UPI000BE9AFDE|nr:MATE family efflux transporter [Bradyrhizobium ottawaense]PDT64122.1 MATE family efflux transporter [Bradyrhizobium ottawaense]